MGTKQIKYLSLLLATTLFLSAASCRGPKAEEPEATPEITTDPITLEYWRLFDESTLLDSFIESYQDEHPNINIEVKTIDFKPGETVYDYQQEIIKLTADGAGPDMFMIHNSWLPYHINQIAPMPKGFMAIKDYKSTFPEVVANDFIKDDRIYAVPYSLDNLMLYYNTDLLGAAKLKPPSTLQELVDMVPKLTKKDGSGRITQSAITLGADTESIPRAADILAALMMQYGADMTSADGKTATFNLPAPGSNPPYFAGQEALKFYTQFANPNSPNTYTYNDNTDSQGNRLLPMDIQAFMEGKSAMFIGNGYHIENICWFAPNKFSFETVKLPQLQLQDPVTLSTYWGETVSKNSKHQNEAWDFIRFMSSKQNLSYFARQTSSVASNKDLLVNTTSRRYYGPIAEQTSFAKSWYRQNTTQVEGIFSKMINDVVKSGVTPEIAIETAVRDINRLNPNR